MWSFIALAVTAWVLFSVPFAILMGRGIRASEPLLTVHNPARAIREMPEQTRLAIAA